jgi:hypothetical protein
MAALPPGERDLPRIGVGTLPVASVSRLLNESPIRVYRHLAAGKPAPLADDRIVGRGMSLMLQRKGGVRSEQAENRIESPRSDYGMTPTGSSRNCN